MAGKLIGTMGTGAIPMQPNGIIGGAVAPCMALGMLPGMLPPVPTQPPALLGTVPGGAFHCGIESGDGAPPGGALVGSPGCIIAGMLPGSVADTVVGMP